MLEELEPSELEYPQGVGAGLFMPHDLPFEPKPENAAEAPPEPLQPITEHEGADHD